MTTTTLSPPAIRRLVETPQHTVSAIHRVQNSVRALPAPKLPQDKIVATAVDHLASTHIIDAHTLVVVAARDRHIQPIAAVIAQHLPGVIVAVSRSAIAVTIG